MVNSATTINSLKTNMTVNHNHININIQKQKGLNNEILQNQNSTQLTQEKSKLNENDNFMSPDFSTQKRTQS